MSIAATIIYAYAWLVPLALWGFLMWRNSKVMNIVSYSFLEIVCVYGYSLFIYIPTAVSTVPSGLKDAVSGGKFNRVSHGGRVTSSLLLPCPWRFLLNLKNKTNGCQEGKGFAVSGSLG